MAIFNFADRHVGFLMRVRTTQEQYLAVFIAVQNLVGIGVAVVKKCQFKYYASLS